LGTIATAQALVDHAKGKWIGGADKGIAEAQAKLKQATTLPEGARPNPARRGGRHHNLALAALVHHKVVNAGEARESGRGRFSFAVLSPEGNGLLALDDPTLHYFDLKARTVGSGA
jgi:hypothetical protein